MTPQGPDGPAWRAAQCGCPEGRELASEGTLTRDLLNGTIPDKGQE